MTFSKGAFTRFTDAMLTFTNCSFENISSLGNWAVLTLDNRDRDNLETGTIINNVTFENCNAPNSYSGGAMNILLDKQSTLTVKGSQTLFKNCGCDTTKTGKGGGIYIFGDLDIELMFEKEIRFDDNKASFGKNIFIFNASLEAIVQKDHFLFAADDNGEFIWKENELMGTKYSQEKHFIEDFYYYTAEDENLNLLMFLCGIKRTSIYLSRNGKDQIYCGGTSYPCKSVEFSVSQFDLQSASSKTLYLPGLSLTYLNKAFLLEKEINSVAFSVSRSFEQSNNAQMAEIIILQSIEALSDAERGCVNCHYTTSFHSIQFDLPENFTSSAVLPTSVISWKFDEHSATLFIRKCVICIPDNVLKPLEYRFLYGEGGSVKIVETQMIGKEESKITTRWEESPFLINKMSGDLTISGLTIERITMEYEACVSVTSSGESSEVKVSIANSTFQSITSKHSREGGALDIKLIEGGASVMFEDIGITSFTSCAAEGRQSKGGGLYIEMTGENSHFQVPKDSSLIVFGEGNRATFGTGMFLTWTNLETKKDELIPLGEVFKETENVAAVCDRESMGKELDLLVYLKVVDDAAKSNIVYTGKSDWAELCLVEEYPCHSISSAMKCFTADDKQKRIIVCGEVEIETDLAWGSATNKEIVISSLPFDEIHSRNVDHSHFMNSQSSRKLQKSNQFEKSRMILAANAVVKAQGGAAIKNTQTLTIEHITFLINELNKDFHPSNLISSGGSTTELKSQSTDRENVSELSSQSDCSISLTDVRVSTYIGTERVTTLNSLLEINSGSLLISGLQISTQFTFAKSPISLADLLILVKITALKIGTKVSSSPSTAHEDNNDISLIVHDGSLIGINRNTINLNGDFSFIESANGPALINIGRDGHTFVSNSHIARCLNGAANEGKGGVFEVYSNGELVLQKTVFEICGMKGEGGCGGAIYVTESAELELHSCIIKSCFTGKGGKGCGGGLFIDRDIGKFMCDGVIISGCSTFGGCGGGIYVYVNAEGNLVQAQIKITFEGNGREEEDASAKGKDAFISDTQATEMTAEANPFYLCGTSEVGRKVYYSNLAIEPAVEKEEEEWLSHDSRKRKVNTNEGTADANCGLSNEQPCKTIKTAIDLFPAQVGAGDDVEKTVELSEENDESEKETILVTKKKVTIEGKLKEDRSFASIIVTNLEVAGTLFAIDTDGTLNLKKVQITHNSKHEENCQSSLFQVNEGSQRANLILQNIQISTEVDYSFDKHFTASLIKSYSGKVRISDISISSFCLEQPAINIVGSTSSLVIGGNSTMKHLSQPTTDSPAGILINTGDEPIDVTIEGISIVDANAPASTKGGGICALLNDESSSFHLCSEKTISSEEKVTLSGCRVSSEAGKGGCIYLSMKHSVDVKFPKYKTNILFDSEGDVKSNALKGKYLFFEAKNLLNCVNDEKFGFLVEDHETYGDWPNLIGCDKAEFANDEIELFRLIFAIAENVIKVDVKDGKDVTWCGGERKCKSFSYGVSRLDFKSTNPSLFLLGSNPFPVSEQLVCKGSEGNLKICGDSSSDAKANLIFAAKFSLLDKKDETKTSCILFETGAEIEGLLISVPVMFEMGDLTQPKAIFELRGTSGCLKLNKVTFSQRESKTESELQDCHILRRDGSMKMMNSTIDYASEYRLVQVNDGSAEFIEVQLENPKAKDFLLFFFSPFFISVSSGGHCTLSNCTFSDIKVTIAKEAVIDLKSCEGATKEVTFTINKCTFANCISFNNQREALSIKSSLSTSRIQFLDDGPTSFLSCEAKGAETRGGGLYIYSRSSEEPFGGVEFPKKKENFVIKGDCHDHEGKGVFLDVSNLVNTVSKENFAFAEMIDKSQRKSLLCGRDDSVFTDKPIDLYSFLLDEYFSDVIFLKGENVDTKQALTSSQALFTFCGHFNTPCKSFGEGLKHFSKDSQRNKFVIKKKVFAEYTYFWTKFDELFVSSEPETFFKKTDLTENECSAIEDDNQYGILDFPSSLTTENDYQAVMSFDYPITFSHLVVSFPPSFKADTSFESYANREESHLFKDNQQAGFAPRGLFFCNGAGTNGKISFEFCTFLLSSAPTKGLDYFIISSSSGMISFNDVVFDGAQQATKSVSESPNINSHANDDENFVLFNRSPIQVIGNGASDLGISNSSFSHISIAKGPLLYLEHLRCIEINESSLKSIYRNGDREMKSSNIGGCVIDIVEQKEELSISIRGTHFSQCTSHLSKQGGAISIISPKKRNNLKLHIWSGSLFEQCSCDKEEGRGGAISLVYPEIQNVLFSEIHFENTNEAKIGKNIWIKSNNYDEYMMSFAFDFLKKCNKYEGAENAYSISISKPEALETDLIPILNQKEAAVRYVSVDGNDIFEFCGMKTLPCKTFKRAYDLEARFSHRYRLSIRLLRKTIFKTKFLFGNFNFTIIEPASDQTKEIVEFQAANNSYLAKFIIHRPLLCNNIEFLMGTDGSNECGKESSTESQMLPSDSISVDPYEDFAFYVASISEAETPQLFLYSCKFKAGTLFHSLGNIIGVGGGELFMDDVLFDGMCTDCEGSIIYVLKGNAIITETTFKGISIRKGVLIDLCAARECRFSHCQFSSIILNSDSLINTRIPSERDQSAGQKLSLVFDNCKWRDITGSPCLSYSSLSRSAEIALSKCSFTKCDCGNSFAVVEISTYFPEIISFNKVTMLDCKCRKKGAVFLSLIKSETITRSSISLSSDFSMLTSHEPQGDDDTIIFRNCLFIANISDSLVCHVCLCDSRKDFIKNTVFDDLCYSSSKTKSVYLDVKVDPSQSGWKDDWMQFDSLERFVDEKNGDDSEGCGKTKYSPCKSMDKTYDETTNIAQVKYFLLGTDFEIYKTFHINDRTIEICPFEAEEQMKENKIRVSGESNDNNFVMLNGVKNGRILLKDLCLVNDAEKIRGAGVSKIISLTDEGEEVSLESCDISGENTKGKVVTTILVYISCGKLSLSFVNVRFDGGDTTLPAIFCEECVKSITWEGGSITAVSKKGDTEQRGSALVVDCRGYKEYLSIKLDDIIFDSCTSSESDCGGAMSIFLTSQLNQAVLHLLTFKKCGSNIAGKGKGGGLFVSFAEFATDDIPILFSLISFEDCSSATGNDLTIQNDKGIEGITSSLFDIDYDELFHKKNLFVVIDGVGKVHDLLTGPDALPYLGSMIYLSYDDGTDYNECGMKEWECKTIEYGIPKLFRNEKSKCFLILETDTELNTLCKFVKGMTLQSYDAAERKTIKVTNIDETENGFAFLAEADSEMQNLNIRYSRDIFSVCRSLIKVANCDFSITHVSISIAEETEQPLPTNLLYASSAWIYVSDCQFIGMKQESYEEMNPGQFVEIKNKRFAENTKLNSRNNGHGNEDECSWSFSMVQLYSSDAILSNVSIERSYKYGGLSIFNSSSMKINEGIFRENGADAISNPVFPSIRRNIICSTNQGNKTTVELESLQPDSDGMKEGTTLWMHNSEGDSSCLVKGNAVHYLTALYFVPSIESVEAKEDGNYLRVTINGKLLLPCNTLVTYVEHYSNSSKEHSIYGLAQESEDKFSFAIGLKGFLALNVSVKFYFNANDERIFIEKTVPWNNSHIDPPNINPPSSSYVSLIVWLSVGGTIIIVMSIMIIVICFKKSRKASTKYQRINVDVSTEHSLIYHREVSGEHQYQSSTADEQAIFC
ncbi:uncharacterized protein MONOS_9927 [Monocercomonoides exilis]|uniref:uncharacterized protein n=1 Tax=Monocercomonoides exilis TaxID=2049356 RepID=UPI00355A0AE6|nr:hypothetical protein MONOS_9927 [Monocercomonoides exilis]|eukprot:MONOS_9927.1-p1 / transcript=MONOS_9927.1 / gene=MONOS_9927 / organism=Monocercomonoides_exilis_PA203 / gene_product=unspecified product / transcript_product=unspecified product / location=Mono_scaffold00428:17879-28861(-) / protein_length=3661 / sequence_SO=supercontig / SO=protein_coding / is_pseudo=false